MAYIGAGITRFNTADDLTVTDDAEIKGELSVDGAVDLNTSLNVDGTVTADGLTVDPSSGDATLTLTSNNSQPWEIYSPDASNDLRFKSDSTDYVTFDTSGNVGIGTDSPDGKMHLFTGSAGTVTAAAGGDELVLENSATVGMTFLCPNNSTANIVFGDPDDNNIGVIQYGHSTDYMAFTTNASEAMRIDSSGNLLLATTNQIGSGRLSIEFNQSTHQAIAMKNNNAGNGANYVVFRNSSGGTAGIISQTGATSVNYGTSSDYRLKENWRPMSGSIDRLKNLNPVNFAWKADGKRVDGFLAHEVQTVVPEAIVGEKDAVDKDGNPQYQSIDQSKLVPLLANALQESIERIETLEAEVAALKGA